MSLIIYPHSMFARMGDDGGPPVSVGWYSAGLSTVNGNAVSTDTLGPVSQLPSVVDMLCDATLANVIMTIGGNIWSSGSNVNYLTLEGVTAGTKVNLSPASASSLNSVSKMSLGARCGYAIREGLVYSFGLNYLNASANGFLGIGSAAITGSASFRSSPAQVNIITDAVHVVGAAQHAHVVTQDGSLYGWGYLDSNRLGNGSISNTSVTSPILIGNITDLKKIVAAGFHTLYITNGGNYHGCGAFQHSFWDAPNTTTRRTLAIIPNPLSTDGSWEDIATSCESSIAIRNGGELWAIGANTFGQLGDGTTNISLSWKLIDNSRTWSKVFMTRTVNTGQETACAAIDSNGLLFTWGSNGNGRTAQGTTTGNTLVPTQVGVLDGWEDVTLGTGGIWAKRAL